MKQQGRPDRSGPAGQKREPIPHVVTPAGANAPGMIVFKNPAPLYSGDRGFGPPKPNQITTHKAGSQGKHR